MQKTLPYSTQGKLLKLARGTRKIREIAALLSVSAGRYTNWELGANRPGLDVWANIKQHLGVDAARLYADVPGSDKGNDFPLDPDVVMQLILAAERNLRALKVLCAPHVSDLRLNQRGIAAPKKTTATQK